MAGLFPLAPVFMDLAGRAVALLSAGAPLVPLAERFAASGASVTAFDPGPDPAMAQLRGVRIVARRWRSADLKGVTLVVAGISDRRPARARAAAKAARAVFLAPGAPAYSDLVLAEAVQAGPLTIGIGPAGLPAGLDGWMIDRLRAASAPLAGFLAAAARMGPEVEARLGPAAAAAFWVAAAQAASQAQCPDWDAWLLKRAHQAVQGV